MLNRWTLYLEKPEGINGLRIDTMQIFYLLYEMKCAN